MSAWPLSLGIAIALSLQIAASSSPQVKTLLAVESNHPDPQVKTVLTAESNHPETSTFAFGEEVELTFSASGLPVNSRTTLQVVIHDDKGGIIGTDRVALTADGSGKAQAVYFAPARKLGYYEVNARLPDGTGIASLGSRPAGFFTYAVVPDPAKRIDYGSTRSRFGLQGGFNSKAVVIPYLGVRYYLYGHDWSHLEPDAPGQFSDDSRRKRHVDMPFADPPPLASLVWNGKPWRMYAIAQVTSASLPSWAMVPGTGGRFCKTFGMLSDAGKRELGPFVTAQAHAFAASNPATTPRIYQVTWEPADFCFTGTPAKLVDMYALSYRAIHEADPKALVAGPTLFIYDLSSRELDDLLSVGLGRYLDVLSIHPYTEHWPPENPGVAILRHQMQATRKAAGHPIGLIGTEHGFASEEVGNLGKAQGDIRTTLMMLGEGASFDFGFYVADTFTSAGEKAGAGSRGFYWNLNPRIRYGTDKLGPKIIVPAFAAMTKMLDGSTALGELPNVNGTQIGYRFLRNSQEIDVAWDYKGQSTFAAQHYAGMCDWMGNCTEMPKSGQIRLTGSPVYLLRTAARRYAS